MSTVQVNEAQVRLSELIRDAVKGQEVVIGGRHGGPAGANLLSASPVR